MLTVIFACKGFNRQPFIHILISKNLCAIMFLYIKLKMNAETQWMCQWIGKFYEKFELIPVPYMCRNPLFWTCGWIFSTFSNRGKLTGFGFRRSFFEEKNQMIGILQRLTEEKHTYFVKLLSSLVSNSWFPPFVLLSSFTLGTDSRSSLVPWLVDRRIISKTTEIVIFLEKVVRISSDNNFSQKNDDGK